MADKFGDGGILNLKLFQGVHKGVPEAVEDLLAILQSVLEGRHENVPPPPYLTA
jgi:hypothetical protein